MVSQDLTLSAKARNALPPAGKWLIIHEWGKQHLPDIRNLRCGNRRYLVLTAIGSDHSFNVANSGTGYMKLGPNNNLAVALPQNGANLVELFHLNDSTGKITNYRKIDLNDNAGQVYGVEFSRGEAIRSLRH
ncbi:MAG: hypothetical protein WDN75_20725 [Bacteroidota bacterium]